MNDFLEEVWVVDVETLKFFRVKKMLLGKFFAIPAELRAALTAGLIMSVHLFLVKCVTTIGYIIDGKKLFVKVHKAVVLLPFLALICAAKTSDFSLRTFFYFD